MQPPIRIGFVLTELVGGGAERSMLSIIGALDRSRVEPFLILFQNRIDHEPPRDVPRFVLPGARTAPGRLLARIDALAALVRRERLDLIVSFLVGPNIVAIAAARRAGVPIVAGERSTPSVVLSSKNRVLALAWLWRLLVRLLYPRATAIVANTEGARRELIEQFGVAAGRATVLPNPIDLERVRALATEPITDPWWPADPRQPILVHVGRFTFAKDHDTLLRAFAALRSRRPATLVLVGDGEDEAHVRALVSSLGLDGDVHFTGFTRNPYKYLARATVSVLTSRFEGLPNALIEAMALGVPIVSTACEYGPVELFAPPSAADGVLVPVGDADAVAGAVAALLDDPARRDELSRRGLVRAEAYDRRRVGAEYERLFERAVRPIP